MKRSYRRTNQCKNLEDVIQEINRDFIKIKKNNKAVNNEILDSVLKELIKLMRENDDLFDSMKAKLEYIGSYYDGLRIGKPTEYDINVVLKLPVDYKKIFLDAKSAVDACTHIFMPSEFRRLSTTSALAKKGFKRTEVWCDREHRLSVQKFRSWMQSVLDAVLRTLPHENGKYVLQCKNNYYHIKKKTSGPAVTISINGTNAGDKIDVDLVPTFVFELPKKVQNTPVLFNKVALTKVRRYFVVPKLTLSDSYSWRLSFPFQEKKYLNNNNYIKSAIKLLKQFRDVQGFHGLASYYIKTLFLWEICSDNGRKTDFWKRKSLYYLVIYMLVKLQNALSEGRISNFWCPSHNLLENLKPETVLNWSNRICFIIRDINVKCKKNPYILFDYFTVKRNSTK